MITITEMMMLGDSLNQERNGHSRRESDAKKNASGPNFMYHITLSSDFGPNCLQ